MAKTTVAILGATGMLGSMTLDWFSRSAEFELIATCRNAKDADDLTRQFPTVEFRVLDAAAADDNDVRQAIEGASWAINAIGIIKPYIHDDRLEEVEAALRVNALFPHLLGRQAEMVGTRVIQIATDCVYSGDRGKYLERDQHDPVDVYGKSKSLGEAYAQTTHQLRCSIIGPEPQKHISLMDWFLGQPRDARVNGFANHTWNGITTLQFARICEGIIRSNIDLGHVQHVVPGNEVTKAMLLTIMSEAFEREDIAVSVVEAPTVIDRTLATSQEAANQDIWLAAGYDAPPTIEDMIAEVRRYGEVER